MNPLEDDFGHALTRLEHMAATGRYRATTAREVQGYLRWLYHLLARPGTDTASDRSLIQALIQLRRRAENAKTPAVLRELVRDIRQYQVAVSSLRRTRELEHRLAEIEGRVRTTAAEAAVETSLETDVVTLQSLKGKRVLFAIMPFSPEFDDVWTGGVKRAATGTGLTPVRIDMITQSSEITDDIVRVIRDSEIVVVDVTANNPNVMFEFGFALALKKKHAVMSQSTEFLTFDIKDLRSIIYKNTWQGVEGLHKDLQAFIRGAIGTRRGRKRKPKSTATASAARDQSR